MLSKVPSDLYHYGILEETEQVQGQQGPTVSQVGK